MKKHWPALALVAILSIGHMNSYTYASSASIHQITYTSPISLAEMMIVIMKASGEPLHPIMDTHYALPAMQKADELGILDLDTYPMETWLDPLSEGAFNLILTKAMQSGKVDMGAVYTALNQILIHEITLNGTPIDLGQHAPSHSNGHIMVPLRPIAEAMGFEVTWDSPKYTATLVNDLITSTVQVGYDLYAYSSIKAIGMSSPMSVGAAPRLIEGTLYVPAEYFNLFATSSVESGILNYILK